MELSRNPPILIELLGQPGAGKSTLVQGVADDLPQAVKLSVADGWNERSFAAKALAIATVAREGSCLAAAIRLVVRARLYSRDSLFRLFRLLMKSHWLRSQTGSYPLQEGHLQDLWSIFYSAGQTMPEPRLIAPFISCLYRGLDAHIILLDLPPEAAFARIRARSAGKSRFDRLDDDQLREQLAATAQLPALLAEGARLAGLPVERLDASLPLGSTMEQLRSIIKRLDRL